MDEARVPDRIHPVVGWRAWSVSADGTLRSLIHEADWPAGSALRAVCRHGHPAPEPECGCGIYATGDADTLLRSYGGQGDANGTVALWGSVVEHELGVRAELAYPREIYLALPTYLRSGRAVGRRYGVPVRPGPFILRWAPRARRSALTQTVVIGGLVGTALAFPLVLLAAIGLVGSALGVLLYLVATACVLPIRSAAGLRPPLSWTDVGVGALFFAAATAVLWTALALLGRVSAVLGG